MKDSLEEVLEDILLQIPEITASTTKDELYAIIKKIEQIAVDALARGDGTSEKKKPTANFDVTEEWTVVCPLCCFRQEAPFNEGNPMQPMDIKCEECGEEFTLTYERDT